MMKIRPTGAAFMVVLGAMAALPPISIDMALPALPLIGQSLHATADQAGLTLSLFMAGLRDQPGRLWSPGRPVRTPPAAADRPWCCSPSAASRPVWLRRSGLLLASRLVQGAGAGGWHDHRLRHRPRSVRGGAAAQTRLAVITIGRQRRADRGPRHGRRAGGLGRMARHLWRHGNERIAARHHALVRPGRDAGFTARAHRSCAPPAVRRLSCCPPQSRGDGAHPDQCARVRLDVRLCRRVAARSAGLAACQPSGLCRAVRLHRRRDRGRGVHQRAFGQAWRPARTPSACRHHAGCPGNRDRWLRSRRQARCRLVVLVPLLVLATSCFGLAAPSALHGALDPLPRMAGVAGGLLTAIQMGVGALASTAVVLMFTRIGPLAMTSTMAACAIAAVAGVPVTLPAKGHQQTELA